MKQLLLATASLALLWGCSQSTPSTEVSQTEQNSSEDSVFPEGTETVVLNVEMSWAIAWPPVVQKALEALPGVVQVKVDGNADTATCYVEKDKFDVEKAIAALADAGYNNSTVQE